MRLTILGVLEDDGVQPTVDEKVRGEEDAPGDRVLAGGGRGAVRQGRGLVQGRGLRVSIPIQVQVVASMIGHAIGEVEGGEDEAVVMEIPDI